MGLSVWGRIKGWFGNKPQEPPAFLPPVCHRCGKTAHAFRLYADGARYCIPCATGKR